ncbi:ATP-dependent DNA helicase RecQ2 [Flavobacterium noncentrifugens]|uniref:ATP-dependent DNA helicase RecQ n=1 Tax=Flavobacterium noncentrifugens TaxID=1128970 RepID=A0A1G9CN21_9FLAO|nr:ATP-dependent DNA helicase RecQ [Flavobacterium noncentrifugens]GEP52096.1 ATP-dependent DNA helicase RecQ2 [Flavobacterium noncentrifugens]SDK53042.1 ATP-dependent DNA helicase RecQ [Flavobacterium noncentrifugens]
METALEILQKYWKHDTFRPLQNNIIDSVLAGNDTFALLPTGGGKSICFQVPAMMKDGICLVVSPLVALMKDQVANLQKRDIKAIALTGGISADDTINLLDNCQFGNYKFLYLSPERLQSDWILDRIKSLPINLIAIDEAHCVSQWGHDFRPAYLKISLLKPHFPKVAFLALTASATQRVQEDIIAQLQLQKPVVFQQSFARKNIAYMVFETEDKNYRIEQILTKYPQPSIIYVRNRKSCLDVSSQLNAAGFRATFYHGGLPTKEKDKNMQRWMNEEVQVIVATNAFGMGIDKANVKTVIHIQLPENIENYYQEAGRAGRNEDKAFAVLLTAPSDTIQAENQFINALPDKKFLTEVYIKLCNYFRIAYGEGIDEQFSFNLNQFCQKYGFPALRTFNAMQFLDRQGIISLSQEFSEKITIQFLIESKEVIRYISLNQNDEEIILAILRTYPGIYDMQTAFNLPLVAKKSNAKENQVHAVLQKLKEKEIIDYHAKNNDATLIFNEVREDERTINRVSKFLENQNQLKKSQLRSVLDYVNDGKNCKSRTILGYFGETDTTDCGICSNCIKKQTTPIDNNTLSEKILSLLKMQDFDSRELEKLTKFQSADVIFAIQHLLENDRISINPNNQYTLRK